MRWCSVWPPGSARKTAASSARELLGLTSKELSPEPTPRTAEFYRKRPCGDLVYQAASLLEELGEKPE